MILSIFFFNQNYVHPVSDFASKPGDFPGLYKHKLNRCSAEHFFFSLLFPVHIVFKLAQEVEKMHKISH